jgi:deoxycytidylate deaminase
MSIAIMNTHRSLRSDPTGCVVVVDDRVIADGFTCEKHSERSALEVCAKRGIPLKDAVLYVTHYPCVSCFKRIIGAGIKRIYYYYDHKNDPIIKDTAETEGIDIIQLMHF